MKSFRSPLLVLLLAAVPARAAAPPGGADRDPGALAAAIRAGDRAALAAGAEGEGPYASLCRVALARHELGAGRASEALGALPAVAIGIDGARLREARARALLGLCRVAEAEAAWEAEPRTQRPLAARRAWLEGLVRAERAAGRDREADDRLVAVAALERRDPAERFALGELAARLEAGTLLPVPSPPARIMAVAEVLAAAKRFGAVPGLALRVIGAGTKAGPAARARAKRLLAEARARRKRGREAEALLAGLAADPELEPGGRAEAKVRRAELLAARGEGAAAEVLLREALATEGPHGPGALERLAGLVGARGARAESHRLLLELAERFPGSWPGPRALLRVARERFEAGDPGAAAASYEDFLARFPADREAPAARYLAGDAWAAAGRHDAARRSWEACLAGPGIPGLDALFAAQRLAGRPGETLGGRHGPGWADFAARLAGGAAGRGAAPLAWVEPGPGLEPAVRARLTGLREAGLFEDLAEDLRFLLAGNPGDEVRLRLALGWAWFRAGRFNESLAEFEKLEAGSGGRVAGEGAEGVDSAFRHGLFPPAYREEIAAAAGKHGLDPNLVSAIAREESHFDPECQSWSDARGLIQMLPSTADWLAGLAKRPPPTRLFEVAENLEYGGLELADLARRYRASGEREALMMAGYNGGPGNVARWRKRTAEVPLARFVAGLDRDETRLYLRKVGRALLAYEVLEAP